MARIIPSGWRELQATGAAQREIETLALLADALPDDYVVYHGVHWTRVSHGCTMFGEIDFAIVSPAGRLLLIEQKSGFLKETPEGLVKPYGTQDKRIQTQIGRTVDAIQKRFSAAYRGEKLQLDVVLYCPDYTVQQPAIAGLDPARIIDAPKRAQLAGLIRSILPLEEPESALAQKVMRFLGDELELVPEVGALAQVAEGLYTRLSGGLAAWGRRIECEPFRLRVIGTAGSGKTQLALAVFRDALTARRRPLYVCYNRPLADHMALILGGKGEVTTYHQLCDRVLREAGEVPDFSVPDAYVRLEQRFAAIEPGQRWCFDELIVDEGQDFHQDWVAALLRLLAPGGRAWWLEDPLQNLYGREPVSLPGWVVLRSHTNYRSPTPVLAHLAPLLPASYAITAGSPLSGTEVEVLTYADDAGLVKQTTAAITQGIRMGFKRSAIAVVSFRGREHSALTPYTQLGPHTLRAPTGTYDLLGNPIHSEGEVLIDSVYRFKGRAAPYVILTEIDFEALDELAVRKLFVGATRATMKLVLVISERAAKVLVARLGQGGG